MFLVTLSPSQFGDEVEQQIKIIDHLSTEESLLSYPAG